MFLATEYFVYKTTYYRKQQADFKKIGIEFLRMRTFLHFCT